MRAWRLFLRAENYRRRGAWRKAGASYRQVLDRTPDDARARLWRGVCLAETGRFDEARVEIERAIELRPNVPVGRLFLARVLYDAGRVEPARAETLLYLEREHNQQGRGLLALCLIGEGRFDDALDIVSEGLPAAPWLLGRLLLAVEQMTDQAAPEPPSPLPVPDLTRAWNPRRLVRRGLLHLRAEKWGRAWKAFARARVSRPDDPRVHFGLGVSLCFLNHFAEARERLLAARDRLDESLRTDAEAALGRIAVELGEPREAVLRLRRALADGAADPQNHYALGLAWLRLGKTVLARRAFERCATSDFVRLRMQENQALASASAAPPPC